MSIDDTGSLSWLNHAGVFFEAKMKLPLKNIICIFTNKSVYKYIWKFMSLVEYVLGDTLDWSINDNVETQRGRRSTK